MSAPRIEIQKRIIEIWRDVLGDEDITPEDDFFDLGGSSIAAIRILPRLAEEFGIDAEVGMLFDNPTPGELAAAVAAVAP